MNTVNYKVVDKITQSNKEIKTEVTEKYLLDRCFTKDGYTNLSPDFYMYEKGKYLISLNLRTGCDKKHVLHAENLSDGLVKKDITLGGHNFRLYVEDLLNALKLIGLDELVEIFKMEK